MRNLELATLPNGSTTVVTVTGTVDAVTAPRLAEALQTEVGAGRHQLVADLSELVYISSAGLRAVLGTLKTARAAGGDLRLAAPQAGVRQVFDLAGFDSIVRIFDEVDDAVASFD